MHITGINNKHKNKKDIKPNKIITNNLINNEDSYRHTSYNKKIQPLFIENMNDINPLIDNAKKDKYIVGVTNNNINKRINYIKLNEAQHIRNNGNEIGNNNFKNIRSNSNCNTKNEFNKINIKPITLKTDKYQQGNTSHTIKFNNIIKASNFGMINKINNATESNLSNLRNNTLTTLKKTKKSYAYIGSITY